MPEKRAEEDVSGLLEKKESLLKDSPSLSQTYEQFRQDWDKYMKSELLAKKSQKSRHRVVFGASLLQE